MLLNARNILLVVILLCGHLVSCTDVSVREDNIKALKKGRVAAIVSGCTSSYNNSALFFEYKHERKCVSTWSNSYGETFYINGNTDIAFVNPGAYEFVGYETPKAFSYVKYPDTMSIFNKLNLKGGEIAYIGHLNVNLTKTKHVTTAMSFVKNKSLAQEYLKSIDPSLLNKMKYVPMSLTKSAQQSKALLSYLDKKKRGKQ